MEPVGELDELQFKQVSLETFDQSARNWRAFGEYRERKGTANGRRRTESEAPRRMR